MLVWFGLYYVTVISETEVLTIVYFEMLIVGFRALIELSWPGNKFTSTRDRF